MSYVGFLIIWPDLKCIINVIIRWIHVKNEVPHYFLFELLDAISSKRSNMALWRTIGPVLFEIIFLQIYPSGSTCRLSMVTLACMVIWN